MNGLLVFNESNAMFAAALAWAQGIGVDTIRAALSGFENTEQQNPGRYNFIDGLPFEVLVDFAHNPEGVRGICAVAAALPVTGRRLLCSLNFGSRNSGFIDELAPLLSATFDDFVLGCNLDFAWQSPDYAGDDPPATMVARYRAVMLEQGVHPDRILCEVDHPEAMRASFHRARPADLVVLLVEHREARAFIDEWRLGAIRNG